MKIKDADLYYQYFTFKDILEEFVPNYVCRGEHEEYFYMADSSSEEEDGCICDGDDVGE